MASIYIPQNVLDARKRRKKLIAALIALWVLAAGLAVWLGLIIFRPMLEDKFKGETKTEVQYVDGEVVTLYSLSAIEDFSASEAAEMLAMDLPEEERWFTEEVVAMYHCNEGGKVTAVPAAQKADYEKMGYRDFECIYVENEMGEGEIIDASDRDNYESEGYEVKMWDQSKG